MKSRLRFVWAALAVLLAAAVVVAALAWPRAQLIPSHSPADWAATPANIARGAYLAQAGDCMACHTARGGQAWAGGRVLDTPFGRLVSPNITPDRDTGIGAWSADDFWNALHNGIKPDGRLLYPAFPYPNYTKVTRADSDALYAYLRSLPAQRQPRQPHALDFPYNMQPALAAWRLLYFKPGTYAPTPARGDAWNRGAYLVEGLGHCGACHSARNSLGAPASGLSGGLLATSGWYAPALTADSEAGLGDWHDAEVVQLLRTGIAPRGAVFGPMAEVVSQSLQHLSEPDVLAMSVYLKSLSAPGDPPARVAPPSEAVMKLGGKLYADHCADCHGKDGRGVDGVYPPLAGNRALTMEAPVNVIRIVLNGGFPPSTAGNPRPYGMPPYNPVLNDEEVAAVVSYVRASWGNAARGVTQAEVNGYRAVPLE
jgi:mono/diheme cytochrome c family protein